LSKGKNFECNAMDCLSILQTIFIKRSALLPPYLIICVPYVDTCVATLHCNLFYVKLHVSLSSAMFSTSLNFRLCNMHQFIFCHSTYVTFLGRITCVSLYSFMLHMSVYTPSCDICQFIFGHVTCVSLFTVMWHMSVSYPSPVRNPTRSGGCFPAAFYPNVYNHAVGFASCGLWSDEYLKCHGFPFLLFLLCPWPKSSKRNASKNQWNTIGVL
jgi:hypothetical protein